MKHLTDKSRLLETLQFCSRVCVLFALTFTLPIFASPTDLVGDTAPDFALRSAEHGNVRISEYRSQVVVLSFRSDWCGKCNNLLPLLNELQAHHGAIDMQVLAVDVNGNPEDVRELLDEQAISFPLLLDSRQQVSRNYDLSRLPVTLLIDREGTVRSVHRGAKAETWQRLQADVAMLLAE